MKGWRATSLAAVTFRTRDDEQVFALHYSSWPSRCQTMSAAEAAGIIASLEDPRGYEVMLAHCAEEIVRVRLLPKAIGWRNSPPGKGRPAISCDCPMCLPRGEVKARRFRERVYDRMRAEGREPEIR